MSESGEAPFGAPTKAVAKAAVSHLAPVPLFNPMLSAARALVQDVNWLKGEIAKIDTVCTNMEQICGEFTQSKTMENAAKHMEASVQRLRQQVTKVSDFCVRMEGVTAELHGGVDDDDFEMPRTLAGQR